MGCIEEETVNLEDRIDKEGFLKQRTLRRNAARHVGIERYFTMKSLILAQDER